MKSNEYLGTIIGRPTVGFDTEGKLNELRFWVQNQHGEILIRLRDPEMIRQLVKDAKARSNEELRGVKIVLSGDTGFAKFARIANLAMQRQAP